MTKSSDRFQVVSDSGGLGDQLARLAMIRELLRLNQGLQELILYVPDYMVPLIRHSELNDNLRLTVRTFEDLRRDGSEPGVSGVQFSKRHHTPGRLTLMQDALLTIADTLDEIGGLPVDFRPVRITPPAKHHALGAMVAFNVGYTSPTRAWPVKEINALIGYVKSIGMTPALLGRAGGDTTVPEGIDSEGCFDFRNKTSLLETLSILEASTALVGVDNGLVHLARTLEPSKVPHLVVGYTSVDPRYRQEADMRVIPTVECKFCQSKCNTLFEHDFRTCFRGDFACVSQMTAAKFKRGLQEVLGDSY